MLPEPLPKTAGHKNRQDALAEKKRFEEEMKRFEMLESNRLQAESFMSMARSLIVVLISSIVFFFHWRMAKKARNGND